MKHAVQVSILGQQYTVKSEVGPEEVVRVAAYVNEQLAEAVSATRSADSLNTAVLTLMNVAGAYLRLRDRYGQRQQETDRFLRNLLERLDRHCPDCASPGDVGIPAGAREKI